MHPVLEDLVAQTGELATLPETVIRLLDILQDDTAAAAQVQTILERDPAMTANVLKLANSAFYGSRRRIVTVRDALVVLGNHSVAALAFATSMAPVLRRELVGYGLSRGRFWHHALLAGAASSLAIAELGAGDLRSEAFTAGLVHDVGMLVIDPFLVNQRLSVLPTDATFNLRLEEEAILGFDHCQAGAALADRWHFPETLIGSIAHHHAVEAADPCDEVVKSVAAGNIIASYLDEDLPGTTADVACEGLVELGLEPSLLQRIRADLTTDLVKTLTGATRPGRPARRPQPV